MTVEIIDGKVVGYLTTEEFANRIGKKPQTIRKLICEGKIPTLKVGRQRFIKEGTEMMVFKKVKRSY